MPIPAAYAAGSVDKGPIQVDGLARDRRPAEVAHGPFPAPPAHGRGPVRIVQEMLDSCGQIALEAVRITRLERVTAGRVEGDQEPRFAVDDDLGDAADRARDDRRLTRHRLEIDDPERLIDRGAAEHR